MSYIWVTSIYIIHVLYKLYIQIINYFKYISGLCYLCRYLHISHIVKILSLTIRSLGLSRKCSGNKCYIRGAVSNVIVKLPTTDCRLTRLPRFKKKKKSLLFLRFTISKRFYQQVNQRPQQSV